MNTKGTIILQCVGCKTKRKVTLAEAARISNLGPICPSCGMPEYAVKATVKHTDIKSKRAAWR